MKSPCIDCNRYKEYRQKLDKLNKKNDYICYLQGAYDRMREKRGVMRI